MNEVALAGALGAALLALAAGAWAWRAAGYRRSYGDLRSLDDRGRGVSMRSPSYRLSGRPDIVRVRPDGRPIPIEVKSRRGPARSLPHSHRVQVEAYCLLLEATGEGSPPYGVVRYGDGSEWQVPWSETARAELLETLDAVRRPYRGAASPAPRKCAGCRWRPGCDAAL